MKLKRLAALISIIAAVLTGASFMPASARSRPSVCINEFGGPVTVDRVGLCPQGGRRRPPVLSDLET